jgi:hypothetical protein
MAARRQYTALQIDQLSDHGRHAIGDGLYLEIDSSGKRWLLRYQLKGKRTWFGLGGYWCHWLVLAGVKMRNHKSTRRLHMETSEYLRRKTELGLPLILSAVQGLSIFVD